MWTLDAWRIADRVRAGDLKAKEVLECFAERIERHNEALLAFVHLDLDAARAQADDIDRRIASGEDAGPLAGVPIGVKDLENVAGMPTQYGSLLFKDSRAERDDPHIARLRAAGGVIVGKTATPEFGSTAHTSTKLHGTTRNPWNPSRTPGGSSGGSAAAVAAALLPIATGSDGGGSIRIPASYSGLFGAKGTFGRIPRPGGSDTSHTSNLGPMARSVRDAARFFDVTMGAHELDPYSLPRPGFSYEDAALQPPPSGLRAVWSDDLGFGACADEVRTIARQAADALAVSWVDLRVELLDPAMAWNLAGKPTTWSRVRDWWPERESDFTQAVAAGVRFAIERYSLPEVARSAELRAENNRRLAALFEDVDAIVTPTTATTAFGAEGPMPMQIDGRPIHPMHAITFTYPFNMSGHPAVSVPCGLDGEALPVGLQLVTRRHDDHVLLQLAAAFERDRPWPRIAPAFAREER